MISGLRSSCAAIATTPSSSRYSRCCSARSRSSSARSRSSSATRADRRWFSRSSARSLRALRSCRRLGDESCPPFEGPSVPCCPCFIQLLALVPASSYPFDAPAGHGGYPRRPKVVSSRCNTTRSTVDGRISHRVFPVERPTGHVVPSWRPRMSARVPSRPVTGVGLDLLEIDRLAQALARRPRLAQRDGDWHDVEVRGGGDGPPRARLSGRAAARAAELGVAVEISLTHSKGMAGAVAVLR